jgi:hypothetical protein
MADSKHRPGQPLPSPGDIAREDRPTFREIRSILAERRQIAILWTVDDVQAVRPDLDEDQAWKLLQQIEHDHDGDYGLTFDAIKSASQNLFPDADPLPPVAVEPAAGGPAEGIEATSSHYIIVPYGNDGRTDEPAPGEAEMAYFFRVFVMTRKEMEELGDFPTFAEAQDLVKLTTGGKAEGQLFEAESFYDLPGLGRWPDVKSLLADLPPMAEKPGPEAKPLPSPGDIADGRDGPEPPGPDRGKGRGR